MICGASVSRLELDVVDAALTTCCFVLAAGLNTPTSRRSVLFSVKPVCDQYLLFTPAAVLLFAILLIVDIFALDSGTGVSVKAEDKSSVETISLIDAGCVFTVVLPSASFCVDTTFSKTLHLRHWRE